MTYYSAKELAASFRTVRGNTITAAREIPEEKYSFSPAPGTRTLSGQLVHIALASGLQEQIHKVAHLSTLNGFNFPAVFGQMLEEEAKPRTKAEVIALLEERGNSFASWLDTLTDDFLGERVEMPAGASPASKSRFEMILSAKEHEMHHRAQVFLIERMIGLVPHGTRAFQEHMAQMQKASEAAKA